MPGLFQSLTASFFLLLAQADAAASSMPLPISVWRVFFLLGWVYLCLHLVQRVEVSPLVPNRYKALLHVVTLFAGPLVFLGLVLADTRKSEGAVDPWADFFQRIRVPLCAASGSRGNAPRAMCRRYTCSTRRGRS